MSKITVGWAPLLNGVYSKGLTLLVTKPQNLFETHIKNGSHRHKLCPATLDLSRNTFVIRSPFDAHFILDADKRNIEFIEPHVQSMDFYNMRSHQYSETDEPIMSINFYQIFFTEEKDIEATVTAPWFEKNYHSFRVIPGRFKISDWWRPLDFAIQLPERRHEVIIKEGDPLFYITFSSRDPSDVFVLKELEITKELDDFINVTTGVKNYRPRCPLKNLYRLFNRYKHKPSLKFLDKI
jgi:hypothetical protein